LSVVPKRLAAVWDDRNASFDRRALMLSLSKHARAQDEVFLNAKNH